MKIRSLISSILLAGTLSAWAGQTMVYAKLDSATMLMGKVNTLRLEVVQDEGLKGRFPLFEKFGPEGVVTLLNDTVELSRPVRIDTVEVGSRRIQINYEVPVQVFDSGVYRLPSLEFVAGKDTARSEQLLLTVNPVKVTADDPISPLTDVADPENSSIFDHLPDWLYYYWWVILLSILLIGGGVFAFLRFKKEGTLLPRKPEMPPYDEAMRDLRNLKERKLWENGREKEYYTELTDILRRYLYRRFGIKAMEMTSNEIMEHLAGLSAADVPRGKMREILDMADFVKFAMARPLPDDNVTLYNNALDFVESTKPVADSPVQSDSPLKDKKKEDQTPFSSRSSSDNFAEGINAGRRGRSARNDHSAERISGPRMKVGKQKKGKEAKS